MSFFFNEEKEFLNFSVFFKDLSNESDVQSP